MSGPIMKDALFQAHLDRTMSYATYAGADVAECRSAAARIQGSDIHGWRCEWLLAAGRAKTAAMEAVSAGDPATARDAWFRASNYFRTAGVFTLDRHGVRRLRDTHAAEVAAFRRGAALLERPPLELEIPYEDTTLPGYFFSAGEGARPTLIVTNGYDGTAEELYFNNAAAGLAHGFHVLVFDGPGQGSMIIERGVPFRPDWERVITPVVDHALTLPGVDPDALVLVGLSFGGYLAPRAATAEPRIAACVSDCGPYDLMDVTAARFPGPLGRGVRNSSGLLHRIACRLATKVMRKPTAGWALRRNLLVHDVESVDEFFELSRHYTLRGREGLIFCPTFVCSGELDDLSAAARQLAARLGCEHEYVEFRAADGAGEHCHAGARTQYHERVFTWLDHVLTADRAVA
jgi:pimeloyl-ACP methyl ester carboxylesterase